MELGNILQKVLLIQKHVAFGKHCCRMHLQPQSSAEVPEGLLTQETSINTLALKQNDEKVDVFHMLKAM